MLSRQDAYALHRWADYLMNGNKFFNPIEAIEVKAAAEEALVRLKAKLFGDSDV